VLIVKKALPSRPLTFAPMAWTNETMLSGFALGTKGERESR